jgi:hypothetical protein
MYVLRIWPSPRFLQYYSLIFLLCPFSLQWLQIYKSIFTKFSHQLLILFRKMFFPHQDEALEMSLSPVFGSLFQRRFCSLWCLLFLFLSRAKEGGISLIFSIVKMWHIFGGKAWNNLGPLQNFSFLLRLVKFTLLDFTEMPIEIYC